MIENRISHYYFDSLLVQNYSHTTQADVVASVDLINFSAKKLKTNLMHVMDDDVANLVAAHFPSHAVSEGVDVEAMKSIVEHHSPSNLIPTVSL